MSDSETTWEQRSCKDLPFAMFFPPRYDYVSQEIRDLCYGCPASNECSERIAVIEKGTPINQRSGIYNAMTPRQRYKAEKAAKQRC